MEHGVKTSPVLSGDERLNSSVKWVLAFTHSLKATVTEGLPCARPWGPTGKQDRPSPESCGLSVTRIRLTFMHVPFLTAIRLK